MSTNKLEYIDGRGRQLIRYYSTSNQTKLNYYSMFDILTRRRLIFVVFAVCFVFLSVLFFGRLIPSRAIYSVARIEDDEQQNSECYLTEPVDVLSLCQKCTSYEKRWKSKSCSVTGYKELVLCTKSNTKTARSCQIPMSVRKQHFWLFESFVLVLGLFSVASVYSRQKNLDKYMAEKISRQIAEGSE